MKCFKGGKKESPREIKVEEGRKKRDKRGAVGRMLCLADTDFDP